MKRAIHYRRDALWNTHSDNRIAERKSLNIYDSESGRKADGFEIAAPGKCFLTYIRNSFGNINACQRVACVERLIVYFLYCARDNNACHVGAAIKRFIADFNNAVRNYYVAA